MKSVRALKRLRLGEIKMEFTPMIDVVFLLLIFFMCTLQFKTLEGKLATYLPTDRGVKCTFEVLSPIEKIRLKLSLRGDQCICMVNGKAVGVLPGARSRVFERIRHLHNALPESPVEIDPDPAVPHLYVVNLIDECMRADVKDINFTAALPALRVRRG
jgi:biopolymer transport protein ExbD